jgi:hypothetical protein
MAVTTVNISSPSNEFVYTDTAMGTTIDAVKASSANVYSISINNTANAGAASYVKLWNLASGSVILGTTPPDEIIYVPQGAIITHNFLTSAATPGKTFGTALSAACVTTGGTAGVTAPSSSVIVTINFV